ncbi:FKBP-type peptidyl-prolyl cis-trans isomerase [Microbacterium sp. P05]|uniref:FKBP-type peptidyl-prolyl cis-trans isomerase n=1 Tax=Microbacterium sp. P05 TaxID=3366948 RepID=UPI003744DE1A
MRFRPIASLSVVAAAVLLMAGCSAGTGEDTNATPAADDLCAAVASPGAASDAVTVGGDFGAAATATFSTPLQVDDLERTVVTEGDGPQVNIGDYLSYGLTAFDATTGEQLGTAGYADAPLQPQQVTADSAVGQLFGCATVGSRIVATLPASQDGGAQIYVLDVLDTTPGAEWCTAGDFAAAPPEVTFAEDGRPTITIPQTPAPDTVSLDVLQEGDGDVVAPGDTVDVNYVGVKWSDGTEFDSNWDSSEPAPFVTNQVVAGFQRALEGQKVGSTVLVAMPPACGYGVAGESTNPLAGETLVFVLKIIGTQPTEG